MKTIPCLVPVTIRIAEDVQDFNSLFPNGIENVVASEIDWSKQEPFIAFFHTDTENKTQCFKIAFRHSEGYIMWTLDADLDCGLNFVYVSHGKVDWTIYAKYLKRR